MPDLFASKAAAQADESADNSIGNITGSNCVNVFLGLGLSWTIGAVYWSLTTDVAAKAEWTARYASNPNVRAHLEAGGGMVFVVEAGDLGISVIVFCCCALACLALLAWRRRAFGGELGGPYVPRVGTACFLVLLWGVYVLVSSLKSVGLLELSL